jgi:hypothetical protein
MEKPDLPLRVGRPGGAMEVAMPAQVFEVR